MPQLRRLPSGWQLPEFNGLHGSPPVESTATELSEVEFYWVGSEARIAGTLVHRWLHMIATHQDGGEPALPNQVSAVTRHWLRGMGIRNDSADTICERVAGALASMLDDEQGRWLLSGQGAAELALSGLFEGELISVVLDRVRIDADGTHWIVDYKTSTHEGGSIDAFLDAEIVRYSPQLQKYRHLYQGYAGVDARCALYFPLLRKFVPVSL